MADTPDTSRGTGDVPLDRKTGGKGIASKETTATVNPPAKTGKQAPSTTSKQLERIAADFLARVKNKADTGDQPSLLERLAVGSQWGSVSLTSDLAMRAFGKDYELSREMLRQYLTGDGDPLVYTPPEPVQKAIRKKFPRPGSWKEVNGFAPWGTPDLRNGIGHFNLDVVAGSDGDLIYVVSDRYEFPDRAGGKQVEHGFQVGRPSQATVDRLNSLFSTVDFKRASGAKEKFELRKDAMSGEYTFIIPQSLLADHGRDFESLGLFTSKPEK